MRVWPAAVACCCASMRIADARADPEGSATVALNGRTAQNKTWAEKRGERDSSSACLAAADGVLGPVGREIGAGAVGAEPNEMPELGARGIVHASTYAAGAGPSRSRRPVLNSMATNSTSLPRFTTATTRSKSERAG